MKKKYSIFSLIKNAFTNNENWQKMWESPEPKKGYDVIIIGGGGHGLGTAYYLAKEHGIKDNAVIEKGWIGGGNTGRNTTIIRSNYLWNESAHLGTECYTRTASGPSTTSATRSRTLARTPKCGKELNKY